MVGWPLRLNGREGIQTRRVSRFIDVLRTQSPCEIETWDERLSTRAAERVLVEGRVSRKGRKAVVDQVAAAIILQGWLDAQQNTHRSY